jgi:hypothetical protein
MDKGQRWHGNRVLLLFAVVLMLVFLGGMVSGCGDDDSDLRDLLEQAAQDKKDNADDADAEDAGATDDTKDEGDDSEQTDGSDDSDDVDVDAGDDGETITVTGDDGEQVVQIGDDAELPEDFPAGLIPDDAQITEVVTYQEGGVPTYLVAIETTTEAADMYDFFLEALDDEGFDVAQKMFMDGGEDDSAIVIVATDGGATLNITGGGQEDEGFTYVLQYATGE